MLLDNTTRINHNQPMIIETDEAIELIQAGITPAKVELAYIEVKVKDFAAKHNVDLAIISGLALRWGIRSTSMI